MASGAGGRFHRWLTFGLSPEQEERFRRASLADDLTQTRITVLAVMAVALAFAANDYLFFKLSPLFFVISGLRLAFLALSLLLLAHLRRAMDYRAYDKREFAWAALVVLLLTVLAATRPHAFVTHAILAVTFVF